MGKKADALQIEYNNLNRQFIQLQNSMPGNLREVQSLAKARDTWRERALNAEGIRDELIKLVTAHTRIPLPKSWFSTDYVVWVKGAFKQVTITKKKPRGK